MYTFNVPAEEENAPAANAENAENENPVDVQNILKPIKLDNGNWKCPYCDMDTKRRSNVTQHIKNKHFGNNFILLLRFLFYFVAKCKQIVWSKLQE